MMEPSGWGEEFSVIGDKGEIGFIDYEDDKSVCSYNPVQEGPIIISVPFPFNGGKPQSVAVGETAVNSITIQNTTSDSVDLWAVRIYASTPEDSFTLSLMEPPSTVELVCLDERVLEPDELLTIWLSCKPKGIGLHTTVVHFDVEGDRIERVVFLLAEDKVSRALASTKPYSRKLRKKQFVVDSYVAGMRPTGPIKQREFRFRLPRYDIPHDIREMLESKQIPHAIKEGLTRENYASYFRILLIMEELHLEEDMRAYDMERVTMMKKAQNLTLEVPGLAERRPSLVHGDFIYAKLASQDLSDSVPPYQGYIHHVEAEKVYLRFAKEFHMCHRDGDRYNVQFTYNRVNMRRLYRAVEAAAELEPEFLFPSESSETRLIATTPLVPITCNLNEEQMCSIEMIIGCKGGPPYVIHGPPGTGKTMTLVEAIFQLFSTRRNSRILVCASSNSAADLILEKLLCEQAVEIREDEIFRLNATTRPFEDVKPDYLGFCCFEDQIFQCPPLHALRRYRIIISTYMSASLLYSGGVKRGHFSHILLDEAGQASEPETMNPISSLCCRGTVVVLAGDPMQLGPVIYSREAESYGLGKSYLERLFDCDCYSSGDENYVTKLVRNYRCHPEILHLPSKLFYRGELIACKDDTSSSVVDILPNKDFPVLFIGIQGCDEREGSNPSWFNRIEASKVVEVIDKLVSSQIYNEEDIGVITPYRQQVLKLKKALEDWDLANVKVGSVEQFQGQEKHVIIISTVRSTVKHNNFDKAHCLGFLSNPRRFNVAITRARSLLLVVGNPHIICKDPYWNKLLWRCVENDSYEGCILPESKNDATVDAISQECSNYEEENPQLSNETEWGELPAQAEWTAKPVTNEDEWSDGWK